MLLHLQHCLYIADKKDTSINNLFLDINILTTNNVVAQNLDIRHNVSNDII